MRQVVILASLLAIAMVASYVTWTDVDDATDGLTTIFKANVDELSAIRWQGDKLDVHIERKEDARGTYSWITVTETKETPKPPELKEPEGEEPEGEEPEGEEPDGEEPEGEEPAEEPPPPEMLRETTTTSFLGGKKAGELWAKFAPMEAMRELDATATDADLGFDGEEAASLTISRRTGDVALQVGGESFGSRDRFVQHDNKTYLVDDANLRLVQYAKVRLIERRVHPFNEDELDRVDVSQGPATASFSQQNKDDRAAAFWARDGSEEEDEAAGTWLGKLFRAKVQDYVSQETLKEANAAPAFNVAVQSAGETWSIQVLSGELEGRTEYFALSEFNRGPVQLQRSAASDAADDLASIFGTETE
jgi:hypothetical protein